MQLIMESSAMFAVNFCFSNLTYASIPLEDFMIDKWM